MPKPTASQTLFPTASATQTQLVQEPTQTLTALPTESRPSTYTLQSGEYPYCIARRFNVDPGELLAFNGMLNRGTFFASMVLQIPPTGKPFPGDRMQKAHPAPYKVSRADETMYTIACQFGDVDPAAIAEANGISIDSEWFIGQQLNIP
jgi:LysM repeat protein